MARRPVRNVAGLVQSVLEAQDQEVETARARQRQAVSVQTASGTGDIDHFFGLNHRFRLVFIRAHFTGTSGVNALVLSLDAAAGSAFDTTLFTVLQAGVNRDVNLRITGADLADPSPWTFQAGDRLRLQWTNPDAGNITWGLEVGLSPAP